MEGDFLSNSFNVKEEGGGEENLSIFVGRLVYVVDDDGGFESVSGKLVFSYESPVNAGDFCTAINKGMGVDSFHCV